MVSLVKVESFDVDVTATSTQTHTLTNTVTLANAFVRRTTSIDKQSGPTTSTGNAAPNIASGAAFLSSTTQVSFRQNTTTSQKIIGEVWRYTGAASGVDEFIVRGRHTITLGSGTATGSTAVSGITNRDKCIPFWTGSTQTATSTSDYDASTVSVYIDGSDNIQVSRQATTGTLVIYVTVVEFTGSNWTVGHGVSSSHDTSSETITLNTASTATGGSTFNVPDWSKAMIIEASLEGDTSETGLSDNLGVWSPGGTTSTATFILHQDGAARNDGSSYCHVLVHPGFVINRSNNTNIAEGNGTYATNATWPAGSSTTEALDELSLEWFCDTSGTGTAHARGRLSARITAATGTIQYWVHRSGNTVRADWGVVELAGVDGSTYIVITDVDGDNAIGNAQLNVVITGGGGFGATQGTGKVELVQNSDYTGTIVNQTSIDSWSDTSIQFDVSSGALADTDAFLFVTNNSGERGSIAVTIGVPPETYQQAVEGMTLAPDHYWRFQNSYADEIGTATANNTSGGTPTFDATTQIVKGDSHTYLSNSTTDYISPADQADMNTSAIARRYIGGWIQLDRVSQSLAVIYEEGAQVNNMAFLNGFGNNMMFQIANAADDYVQLYFDVSLTPNRPYFVLGKLAASGFESGNCELFLDGVLQTRSNGNPWETPQLDSHSGNITWGHEGTETLKVGDDRGVDATTIAFVSPVNCNYAHWFSWSNVTLSIPNDIRKTLFEKGALAEVTIAAGTQSVMQTSIDAQANTLFTDWPCSIEIAASTDGNFELTLDNITFEDRVSMQIRYMGADTLTLVTKNGTVLDTAKLGVPYGGTITIINEVALTVTVRDLEDNSLIQGARVRMEADTGGPEVAGTVLLEGSTDVNGQVTTGYRYSSSQPVTGIVRKGSSSTFYKQSGIEGTIGASGIALTIYMVKDE